MTSRLSRFRFCSLVLNTDGTMFLTDREPFRYVAFDDNIIHTVVFGDTWHSLAFRYYFSENVVEFPERLWWVIADFQPTPVVDPFIKLPPGTLVHIPSFNVLFQFVFNENRRVLHK